MSFLCAHAQFDRSITLFFDCNVKAVSALPAAIPWMHRSANVVMSSPSAMFYPSESKAPAPPFKPGGPSGSKWLFRARHNFFWVRLAFAFAAKSYTRFGAVGNNDKHHYFQ